MLLLRLLRIRWLAAVLAVPQRREMRSGMGAGVVVLLMQGSG